jgi:FKBP-type peptidyl-prolyl cis-trans isomerase 2
MNQESTIKNKKIIASIIMIIIIGLIIGVLLSSVILKVEYVELGDCVEVEYTGRFLKNNTVFISTYTDPVNKTGGEPARIFINPDMTLPLPRGYESYTSSPTLMPSAAIKKLVGMQQGETRNITLSPDEAYGEWNTTAMRESLISEYNVSYYSRFTYYHFVEEIRAEYLPFAYPSQTDPDMNYGSLNVNQSYTYMEGEPSPWIIKIIGINGSYVTIQHIVSNGTVINRKIWNSTIIIVNSTIFKERADPVINTTFSNSFEGFYQHIKIVDVNETGITFAFNTKAPDAKLVGESLVYECKVTRIHKTSKKR